ncbi:LPXTG cell wall anchor domain-containing protein [Lacrimispora saccharolytica]|nr:LPXTG cell wall anchor domain-containing protein [Lacrimispora saccharolytica]QRV18713.1 LPXTG cell wall anchor domain-containing protein [Lacrimispora saccharolytica]
MKSWTVFLIAIGCLFITVSPQLPSSALYMAVGLIFVLLGAVMLIKRKK